MNAFIHSRATACSSEANACGLFIVNDPESVSPRVDCIVCNDFVAANIDISLHLGLLFTQTHISFPEPKAEAKGTHRLRAQVIHMRPFEIKESHLSCIVPLPFLHYPPGEVCLTQQLVKGMHGRIELDSSPGASLATRSRSGNRHWTGMPHRSRRLRHRATVSPLSQHRWFFVPGPSVARPR